MPPTDPSVNLLSAGNPPPAPTAKKILLVIAAIAVLGITAYAGHTWAKRSGKLLSYASGRLQAKPPTLLQSVTNFIFRIDNILQGQDQDRVNILLLGIGGPGHDGPYLTDTSILLSIKPSTREVALVSVPRDLAVKINGFGIRKINSADAFGEAKTPDSGGEYARQIFEQTFNIPIPYYIRVDFKAFQEVIDDVGGITVDVPRSFTDNLFPLPDPSTAYQTIHFDAGPRNFNGERTLDYVRSRHGDNGEGSDFARSRRQELVLAALKDKLLSFNTYSNPVLIKKIYDSITSHVLTNLDFSQMAYLASLAKDVTINRRIVLDSSYNGYLVNRTGDNGAFLLYPRTGNFDAINATIADIFNETLPSPTSTIAGVPQPPPNLPTPSASVAGAAPLVAASTTQLYSAKLEIQNGTWRVGLASRWRQTLTRQGFTVLTTGNTIIRPIATTAIYRLDPRADKTALAVLSQKFRAPILTDLPYWLKENYDNPATPDNEAGMKYDPDSDVLIILGQDAPADNP